MNNVSKSLNDRADEIDELNESMANIGLAIGIYSLAALFLCGIIALIGLVGKIEDNKQYKRMNSVLKKFNLSFDKTTSKNDLKKIINKAKFCKYKKDSFTHSIAFLNEASLLITKYKSANDTFMESLKCDNMKAEDYKEYYSRVDKSIDDLYKVSRDVYANILILSEKYKTKIKNSKCEYSNDINEFKSLANKYVDSFPIDTLCEIENIFSDEDVSTPFFEKVFSKNSNPGFEFEDEIDNKEEIFYSKAKKFKDFEYKMVKVLLSVSPDAKVQLYGSHMQEKNYMDGWDEI